MLSRDELVLHLVCLCLRRSEDLRQTIAEVLLAALYTWKACDRRLRIVKNDGDVRSELAEYRSNNSFRLFEHCDEQMLRLNLLVLVLLRQLDRGLNRLLASQCELI